MSEMKKENNLELDESNLENVSGGYRDGDRVDCSGCRCPACRVNLKLWGEDSYGEAWMCPNCRQNYRRVFNGNYWVYLHN